MTLIHWESHFFVLLLLLLLLLLLTTENTLVNVIIDIRVYVIIDIRVYYYFNYIAWIIYLYAYANIVCVKFVRPKIQNSTRSKYFLLQT